MENLLDKFIRNEKKAKLWALLSLLAFFATAASVVVVAYNIKNAQAGQGGGSTTVVTDTVFISKEDPATAVLINEQAATVRTLIDSINAVQVRYEERVKEVNTFRDRLRECLDKPGGGGSIPPTPTKQIAVLIYTSGNTYKVPDTSIEKLQRVISKNDNSKNGMKIDWQETQKIEKPRIIYYEDEFADEANHIAGVLNQSRAFYPMFRLTVIRGEKGPADILILPGYFR